MTNKEKRIQTLLPNNVPKWIRCYDNGEIADGGTVTFRKDIIVTYLDQNPHFDGNSTVIEAIYNTDNPMLNAVRDYESALTAFTHKSDFLKFAYFFPTPAA